jgi:16S rRNA (cytosine967-C5)-methyltransferase
MNALGPHNRALATRLVLGATAASGELDRRVLAYVRRTSHLEPRVSDAFRISAFEVLYLSTPSRVSVSQGVELVRHVAPRAAGMANAILRKLAANDRPEVDAARSRVRTREATEGDLAIAGGLPSWLVSRIVGSCGLERACDLASAELEPAPTYVTSNTALHTAAETADLLEQAGLGPKAMPLPGSFALAHPAGLATSGLVGGVDVVVSDLGAQLTALVAAPMPGTSLLEVGQGRASKTILLQNDACALGGPAELTSVDSVPYKVRVATERVAHGWSEHVHEVCYDVSLVGQVARPASSPVPSELDRTFDAVFLDAPCSGTGTMRRHPEIPWSLDEGLLMPSAEGSITGLQLRLLESAATRVRPGGSLTYATCSILREEDERVIEAFLLSEQGQGFTITSVSEAPAVQASEHSVRSLVESNLSPEGFLRTHPRLGGFDGHFCARLVRER